MRTGECFEFGWETFKRHASTLVFLTVVLILTQMLLHLVLAVVLRHFAWLGVMLLNGLIAGGYMTVARIAARGDTPTLQDAFWPFTERQGDFLLVGLAMGSGLLLCGVGVLITSLLFMFAPLCVVEGGDFKASLARSKDLVMRDTGQAVVFFVLVAALNLAGALALGVGVLVTMPVSALAVIKAYEQASAAVAPPPVLPTAV